MKNLLNLFIFCLYLFLNTQVLASKRDAQNETLNILHDSVKIELKAQNLEAIITLQQNEKFSAKLTYTYENENTVYEPKTVKLEPIYEAASLEYLSNITSAKVLITFTYVHEDYCELKCFKNFQKCNGYYYNNELSLCRLYEYSNDAALEELTQFKDDFDTVKPNNQSINVENEENYDSEYGNAFFVDQPKIQAHFKNFKGFKQIFIIRGRIGQNISARINLIKKIGNKFNYVSYNLNRFKLIPKLFLNYDTETFKAANKGEEFSFVANLVNCVSNINTDLVVATYPIFRKKTELEFKSLPRLIKPLTDDFSGYYKCRMVILQIDGKYSTYDTNEIYLDVIENEKPLDAPSLFIDSSDLSSTMAIKLSWKPSKPLLWDNVRRIKLIYYVNNEPYGLVMKSMFTVSNYSTSESSLSSQARNVGECALICLMNNECQHFEFNGGTCLMSYSVPTIKHRICQKVCYEIKRKSEYVNIRIAPYHNYTFQVAIQDHMLRWSKYSKPVEISYNDKIAEDPIQVTFIPANNYNYQKSIVVNCQTAFLENSFKLSFKKAPQSYIREETVRNSKSRYAQIGVILYIESYYYQNYNNLYINYTCMTDFDMLDVYPHEYSMELGRFYWPLQNTVDISIKLNKQYENSYTLSWTITDTRSSNCIKYRPKFYIINKYDEESHAPNFDSYQDFLMTNNLDLEFKLVNLNRISKNSFPDDCAVKCLENINCKGYLYLQANNTCLNFEKIYNDDDFKTNDCENCIRRSFNVEWLNDICENCFGTVKNNILKTGSMELFMEDKKELGKKIRAQVKCVNPLSEAWSWPVQVEF